MTYRDDAAALRMRHDALARELAELEAKLADLELVEAARDRIAAELLRVRRDLDGTDRPRVRLAQVRIATPCKEKWDAMVGEGRVRTCVGCAKPVFDISGMTTTEAEDFLASQAGQACVRFFRRADGTIKTTDCPPTRARWIAAAMTAGALATSIAGAAASTGERPEHQLLQQFGIDDHPEPLMGLVVLDKPVE